MKAVLLRYCVLFKSYNDVVFNSLKETVEQSSCESLFLSMAPLKEKLLLK